MNTPIYDFIKNYAGKNGTRFHMPGHKGHRFLGCEAFDITEVAGADSLYEADGIIAESEANAAKLFGTGRTLFSTEGSSQCIRAMLYLAVSHWKNQLPKKVQNDCPAMKDFQNNNGFSTANNYLNTIESARPYIIAARNVHKSFLYAAALIDFDVVWLYPEEMHSLCSCHISPEQLEEELKLQAELKNTPPAAVYVTSPDYLGGQLDIAALAHICHKYNTLLLVDNAHGAYLHFLEKPMHPMDLGADMCCDSAHKTLPVLTGGAYLQISKNAPASFAQNAKTSLALFGSTSPSYLTLASLDRCNAYLAEGYREKLAETVNTLENARGFLRENGWNAEKTEPLKLTIRVSDKLEANDTSDTNLSGIKLADKLRQLDVECEYADSEYVVLMATPENTLSDYGRLFAALSMHSSEPANVNPDNCFDFSNNHTDKYPSLKPARCEQKCSIREAIFASHELISVSKALGRICGTPTVGCPPAIPIVVSGELIDENAIALFEYYGITEVDVIC